MDVNATLAELREMTTRNNAEWDAAGPFTLRAVDHDAYRFAELFGALDEWIVEGGHLPRDWRQGI